MKIFLLKLTDMNFKNDLPKNELVEKIIDYINKNFTKGINNTHIAKFLGYHPNYLNRIFKENMNISIHHYILNLRIEKAKNMLSETPLSAYEISKKVGFNDYSYFSSYFKQKIGVSPNKFRRTNINII